MAHAAASAAFEKLVLSIADEEGVVASDDALSVHGRVFATVVGDDLVVSLPTARITDLVFRGVAAAVDGEPGKVRVSDLEIWNELAREAYEFVGEPPVGGES
jgi:hypothetical protein